MVVVKTPNGPVLRDTKLTMEQRKLGKEGGMSDSEVRLTSLVLEDMMIPIMGDISKITKGNVVILSGYNSVTGKPQDRLGGEPIVNEWKSKVIDKALQIYRVGLTKVEKVPMQTAIYEAYSIIGGLQGYEKQKSENETNKQANIATMDAGALISSLVPKPGAAQMSAALKASSLRQLGQRMKTDLDGAIKSMIAAGATKRAIRIVSRTRFGNVIDLDAVDAILSNLP